MKPDFDKIIKIILDLRRTIPQRNQEYFDCYASQYFHDVSCQPKHYEILAKNFWFRCQQLQTSFKIHTLPLPECPLSWMYGKSKAKLNLELKLKKNNFYIYEPEESSL